MNAIRFVIYTQGRTGSVLLVSLLNQHPHIRCYGELFHPNNWRGPLRSRLFPIFRRYPILYLQARAIPVRRLTVGFKLLYAQSIATNRPLWKLYNSGWRVIYLQRRNLLERTLSACMLRITGISHRSTPINENEQIVPVSIEPALFERIWHKTCQAEHEDQPLLAQIPHLTLTYEDDLAQSSRWQPTADRVFAYLGLPSAPVSSGQQKTYSRPYAELISNYESLVEIARKSGIV